MPAFAADGCALNDADRRGESAPLLKRGVNLSRMWEQEQDRALNEDELAGLRKRGFDFVRLPFSPFWLEMKDDEARAEKLHDLHCDLIKMLNAGLVIVLDLHPSELADKRLTALGGEKAEARIEKWWEALRPVLEGLPAQDVLLGLYNEPEFETTLWWSMQERMVDRLRHVFPDNRMVVTTSPDGGWWKLVDMKPYRDTNLLYDFHFYEPMVLTHHGAEWLPTFNPKHLTAPIAYPIQDHFHYDLGDPEVRQYVRDRWNRAEIDSLIQQVAAWRDHYKVSVACLEFGVYRPHIDNQSRLAWLRDVSDVLEAYNLPWAVWEYKGPFGFIDTDRPFDENMAEALALGHSRRP